MIEPGVLMAATAALILLAVLASKVSDRLGVPALLLFIVIGMLAGSEGIGGIEFTDLEAAQAVGIVALAFILFDGGLSTEWSSVRPVLGRGILLATAGVVITAVVVGVTASWVLDLSLTAGLLLGAIVSSTDAAAVFAVLRSRNVSLTGQLRPLLELESGSNDPMAVFLTVAFLELLTNDAADALDLVVLFVAQMVVGAVVGYLAARAMVAVINRVHLGYDGLYPVVMIAVVLLTFGLAAMLGGSGFLASYVAGMVMGNATFLHKRSLMRFTDGLAWLMQISMFLVLGLLAFPSDVWAVAGRALLLSAVLILVARPIATVAVLALTRFGSRATLMVSWVGLRGAVPIVLATFALVERIPQAEIIFNVVFFIVITSVLVQGTTIPVVARWLRVDAPLETPRPYPLEFVPSREGTTDLHDIAIPHGSPAVGRQLVDLGMPRGSLIVLVRRDDNFVVPTGSTMLEAGDSVLLLADDHALAWARSLIERGPSH